MTEPREQVALPEIIVGVDGSAASNLAVRWAARESAFRSSPLRLVHVAAAPSVTYALTPVPVVPEDWQDDLAKRVLADAVALVYHVSDESGMPMHLAGTQTYHSAVTPTLIDLTRGAEMIVVGSRGMGAFRRGVLGSVSTALVQHAHCPVAVIHDGPVPADDDPVVLGVDGSPASEAATAIAFQEAAQRGVDLVAVHAWSDSKLLAVPGVDWSAMAADEEAVLAEQLAGMVEKYPDVTVRRVVVNDQPTRHLVEQSENAQLLVVGSRGRGGFAGMLLGSVSTALAHDVQIPLIVARKS
jgi:nucleotide-binding universal stress UspA family protein